MASEVLSGAVRAMLIVQMARALLAARADLQSEADVSRHLARAGFGLPSVGALRRRATEVAAMVAATDLTGDLRK